MNQSMRVATLFFLVVLAAGCASAGKSRTSRLTAGDILETAASVRQSLANDPWLSGRGNESPPIRLGISEAVNKSNDRLATSDRWALTALVVYDRSVQSLLESRNVRVHLPEETQAMLGRMGIGSDGAPAGAVGGDAPTHVLLADVRSISRQGSAASSVSDERYDLYVIDYRVAELTSGRIEWSHAAQVARRAFGTVAD
ncbi:MAG: hypothetical protein KF787_06890 [Phycisphaeraceae bacterium]|nr:hypothetical protein [Phycisphaerae bacterium]MBX3392360.1 hypothetical protein [Phycisphaeraceae bacterium]HRJ49376.1 hypothetical protein [Phycisphaerales bacterium]